MSRRDRRQQPEPSAPPPTVAKTPIAAPESALAGVAAGDEAHAPTIPPPAPPEPRYVARVTILARPLGQWSPGDEVPAAAALALLADGFTLGRELDKVEG